VLRDEPLNLSEFRRGESAAPGKSNGIQPELRPIRIPFDVDVNRLVSIR
jgi:hypothetical protein